MSRKPGEEKTENQEEDGRGTHCEFRRSSFFLTLIHSPNTTEFSQIKINFRSVEMSSIIPVEYSVTASSINEAKRLFRAATHRLLSIGEWNRWCNGLSAMFRICDDSGRIINRKARPKDQLKVNDNDLHIARLITYKKPSGKSESMSIEITDNQSTDGEELFEIKRYNNVVTAIVHEPTKPEVSKKLSFVSQLEWSTLVKRLLAPEANGQ